MNHHSSRAKATLLATLISLCLPLVAPLSAHAQTPALPPISEGFTFVEKDGASLYRAICQSCHMPNAQGATGAGKYPALAKNPLLASSGYLVHNVVHGRRGMPAFGGYLSDGQIAELANYVRTNFGNSYTDPVSAADVAKLR